MSTQLPIANSRDWLAGTEQIQRYVAAAVIHDTNRYGPLPYKVERADVVQEVFVVLLAPRRDTTLAPIWPDQRNPIQKDCVARVVRRVIRRYRDRQYQRRRRGLRLIGEMPEQLEPLDTSHSESVRRIGKELENDLGSLLSDEEAILWHKLTTEDHKTVREIAAELGIRHQRVSEVRQALEAKITEYLLSRE